MNPPCAPEREAALNPTQSFIVQAPAGSGKTSLLVARILTLLATEVSQPEEILAITFTRKAAAEMRLRIIEALDTAATQPRPETGHAAHVWDLAHAVLEKDLRETWHLREHPNRLNVMTIDACCASIVARMPLTARANLQASVSESPETDYMQAALSAIDYFEQTKTHTWVLERLLKHFDNKLSRILSLTSDMLGQRDQWLPYLAGFAPDVRLKPYLEKTLLHLNLTPAQHVQSHIETHYCLTTFDHYWQMAQNHLRRFKPDSPLITTPQCALTDPLTPETLPTWRAVARWLLTAQGQLRKTLTVQQGVPAATAAETPDEKSTFKAFKQTLMTLLDMFSDDTDIQQHLNAIFIAPPLTYPDTMWETVEALGVFLPNAAACLNIVFAKAHKTDFIALTQHASHALGELSNPTDLALSLDYQMKHLLIDEFQDTSSAQYELLLKLTQTWEEGDGRTLFLVGDPMQSIYRFRGGNVSLFTQLQTHGMSNLNLRPVYLQANFRSDPTLIEFFNATFQHLFPVQANTHAGGVPYRASSAHASHTPGAAVHFHRTDPDSLDTHIPALAHVLQDYHKTYPQARIAVLVRSRQHLGTLFQILNESGLRFNAPEIEALDAQPIIQDLICLTRALSNLQDDIAWTALLRAPWCGLTLTELTYMLEARDTHTVSHTCLNYPDDASVLSQKLKRIRAPLLYFFNERGRHPFSHALAHVWISLGGQYAWTDAHGNLQYTQAVNDYFDHLRRFEATHTPFTYPAWEKQLAQLSASLGDLSAPIEVMTIHKAKGLEFDCVFIPHCEKRGRANTAKLLNLHSFPEDDQLSLMMAPAPEKNTACAIYTYLSQLDTQSAHYELTRLLYVAATRAKHQVHFFAAFDPEYPKPQKNSFLGHLWPVCETADWISHTPAKQIDANAPLPAMHPVQRFFDLAWEPPYQTHLNSQPMLPVTESQAPLVFNWQTERLIGLVCHEWFKTLAESPVKRLPESLDQHIALALKKAGCLPTALVEATHYATTLLTRCVASERGRWVLDHTHEAAASEYAISYLEAGEIKQAILDRTFIADGMRWIIDYKTAPESSHYQHYIAQLTQYATLFLHEERPLRCALYYPYTDAWIAWTPDTHSDTSHELKDTTSNFSDFVKGTV